MAGRGLGLKFSKKIIPKKYQNFILSQIQVQFNRGFEEMFAELTKQVSDQLVTLEYATVNYIRLQLVTLEYATVNYVKSQLVLLEFATVLN